MDSYMTPYTLVWPPNFDTYAAELDYKGWFRGLEIIVGGRTIKPVFYDPVRLAQEIQAEFELAPCFFEPCLIVVNTLSRASIDAAVARLVENRAFETC